MEERHFYDDKDLIDALKKIVELQRHFRSTDKKAIKKALLEAKKIASKEITALEWRNKETVQVDLEKLPLPQLHRKIHQYQNGLKEHCLLKLSQKELEEYLKKYKDT